MPGEALGTPSYMSPEQITGGHLDGRSDLFSLGIILYSMLAGQKPFPGENATSVMFNITYKEPLPLTQLNPSLDPQLNHVIERALAKNPADRYQPAESLRSDLESLGQGRPLRSGVETRAEPDPEQTTVQRPSQSFPTPSAQRNSPASQLGGLASHLAAPGFRQVSSEH